MIDFWCRLLDNEWMIQHLLQDSTVYIKYSSWLMFTVLYCILYVSCFSVCNTVLLFSLVLIKVDELSVQ